MHVGAKSNLSNYWIAKIKVVLTQVIKYAVKVKEVIQLQGEFIHDINILLVTTKEIPQSYLIKTATALHARLHERTCGVRAIDITFGLGCID